MQLKIVGRSPMVVAHLMRWPGDVFEVTDAVGRQALQEHGTEVQEPELDQAFHLTDKQFMREYPGVLAGSRLTWTPWYLGVLHHRLGLKLPICPLAARWAELQGGPESYWKAFDFAAAVLDRLRARGLRLGVISNWDSSARPILTRQGLLERFEALIPEPVASPVAQLKQRGKARKRASSAKATTARAGKWQWDDQA